MPIHTVTFDCAETLLQVDWHVGRFAVACAEACGVSLPSEASNRYVDRFQARKTQFLAINRTENENERRRFWREVTADWLQEFGIEPLALEMETASETLAFGPNSILFRLFDDVRPCLEHLRSRGIVLGVISNWDYSLPRALAAFGLESHFQTIVASLVLGIEKPHPEIFLESLRRLDAQPETTLHVGDNPLDDLQGARSVGMHALLVDRSRKQSTPPYVKSLLEIPAWIEACA